MELKRFKEIINSIEDDNIPVFSRNFNNPCGNISFIEQVELTTYGFFGKSLPCLILNNSKGEGEQDFIKTTGVKGGDNK